MDHASREDFSRHPKQLARLAADPLIARWLDADRVADFVAGELERIDPYSARIAEAEAAWLRRVQDVALASLYDTP